MIFQPIEEFNELEFFLPLKSVNLRNMGQVSSNVVHYAKGQHLFLRQFHTDLVPKIIILTFFSFSNPNYQGLRMPREEVAFTARPKIHSHFQIFRYGQSIFCLPHRPNFSDTLIYAFIGRP